MSLGGDDSSVTQLNLFRDVFLKKKRIVVAAAGNSGTNQMAYPASYPYNVGVGAIDQYGNKASFSNYNDGVDFCAPGVSIASTTPPLAGNLYISQAASGGFAVYKLGYSTLEGIGNTGKLVDCGVATSLCPGGGGHICIIRR